METTEIAKRFSKKEFNNRFYNESIDEIHKQFYIFARQIEVLLNDGREKSLMMTSLEEAMMWAIQSLNDSETK
jgi:hypothetical protein